MPLPPLDASAPPTNPPHNAFVSKLNTEPLAAPGSTQYQASAIKSQLAVGNPGGAGAASGLGISFDTGA
jgi:hypothetical protein